MKVVNLKCPIIGCENPEIKTYAGRGIENQIDVHIMRAHTTQDIIDFASKEIRKYNKKRIQENESQ